MLSSLVLGLKTAGARSGCEYHKRTVPFVARGSQARALWREGHRPHGIAITLQHQLLFFVVARGRRSAMKMERPDGFTRACSMV